MKIVRSILLMAIGVASILIGTIVIEPYQVRNEGAFYIVDSNGEEHGQNFFWYNSNTEHWKYVFILGGAALIVCAIPTNLKKKGE